MMRRSSYAMAFAGAALLAACSDGDALTSPIGTTMATVHMAASPGSQFLVVFDEAPPMGFAEWVAGEGGTVQWSRGRVPLALVAGLPEEAAASLPRVRGVAEVRRVR